MFRIYFLNCRLSLLFSVAFHLILFLWLPNQFSTSNFPSGEADLRKAFVRALSISSLAESDFFDYFNSCLRFFFFCFQTFSIAVVQYQDFHCLHFYSTNYYLFALINLNHQKHHLLHHQQKTVQIFGCSLGVEFEWLD